MPLSVPVTTTQRRVKYKLRPSILSEILTNVKEQIMREIINGRYHEWFEEPKPKVLARCSHCKEDICYEPFYYNEYPLCEDCCEEINEFQTRLNYCKAYPDYFWEFLSEHDGDKKIMEFLNDYIDDSEIRPLNDFSYKTFSEWFELERI